MRSDSHNGKGRSNAITATIERSRHEPE
jgi:hypothetical protein